VFSTIVLPVLLAIAGLVLIVWGLRRASRGGPQ